MGKTKIEWATDTINCVTGCLGPEGKGPCDYCFGNNDFAPRLAGIERKHPGRTGYPTKGNPFYPTWHPNKLEAIRKLRGKGKRIFLDSMSDLFGYGVDPAWIHKILDEVDWQPDQFFLMLTKSAENILPFLHCRYIPQNLWIGVSVTKTEDLHRVRTLVKALPRVNKFISFEPLHGRIDPPDTALASLLEDIRWIIIGAETGNRKEKIIPEMKWISELCWAADGQEIPVFLKDNLMSIVGGPARTLRQEFPEEMRR